MITVLVAVVPVAAACVVVAILMRDRRVTRARRAAYLAEYPSIGSVLAVIDRDEYRQIQDQHGRRTGAVHAARAIMRDFPGITVAEAAEVVSALEQDTHGTGCAQGSSS